MNKSNGFFGRKKSNSVTYLFLVMCFAFTIQFWMTNFAFGKASTPNKPNIVYVKFKPNVSNSEKERIISSVGKNASSLRDHGNWIRVKITNGMNADDAIKKLKENPAVRHAMPEPRSFSPYLTNGDIQVRLKPDFLLKDKQRVISAVGKEFVVKGWPKNYLLLKITNEMTVDEAIRKLEADFTVIEAHLPPNFLPGEVGIVFKPSTSVIEIKQVISKIGLPVSRVFDLRLEEKVKKMPLDQEQKKKIIMSNKKYVRTDNHYRVKLKYGLSVKEALEMLEAEPSVDHANLSEVGSFF